MNSAVEIDSKWIRHRGGKQPVADGTEIEYKLRDGTIGNWAPERLEWDHTNHGGDIMQYRIISQPQAEEAKLSRLEARMLFSEPCIVYPESTETKIDQIDGPIKWRDTIIHCQAIIEDCEREIERNVQLLDAEGLMMQKDSKKAMQHYAPDMDMGDWRNWKVGDEIEMTADDWCDLSRDCKYKITHKAPDGFSIIDDEGDTRYLTTDRETVFVDGRVPDFKWISRP